MSLWETGCEKHDFDMEAHDVISCPHCDSERKQADAALLDEAVEALSVSVGTHLDKAKKLGNKGCLCIPCVMARATLAKLKAARGGE